MKRIFSIEWPDDCGPMWMNKDNLMSCLTTSQCVENVELVVEDLTERAENAEYNFGVENEALKTQHDALVEAEN